MPTYMITFTIIWNSCTTIGSKLILSNDFLLKSLSNFMYDLIASVRGQRLFFDHRRENKYRWSSNLSICGHLVSQWQIKKNKLKSHDFSSPGISSLPFSEWTRVKLESLKLLFSWDALDNEFSRMTIKKEMWGKKRKSALTFQTLVVKRFVQNYYHMKKRQLKMLKWIFQVLYQCISSHINK